MGIVVADVKKDESGAELGAESVGVSQNESQAKDAAMGEPETVVMCFSTAPSVDVAKAMAAELLERRLAACVSIVPGAVSMYRWQGKVQCENEAWMLIKTTRACCAGLQATFVDLHPYEVPEWLVVGPESVLPAYLRWVLESVEPAGMCNVDGS